MFDHIDSIHEFGQAIPDVSILVRLDTSPTGRAPREDTNMVRLGSRYRPSSEESRAFFRDHGVTSSPRATGASGFVSRASRHATILVAPAKFEDMHYVQDTMNDIDELLAGFRQQLLQNHIALRQNRKTIGQLTLMRPLAEPFDSDCLYLLTLEMLGLAVQYDAHFSPFESEMMYDQLPDLKFRDFTAEEARVVLRAVSRPDP